MSDVKLVPPKPVRMDVEIRLTIDEARLLCDLANGFTVDVIRRCDVPSIRVEATDKMMWSIFNQLDAALKSGGFGR